MNHSLPKRLADLYLLLAFCALPMAIVFAVHSVSPSQGYYVILKILFIIFYLSILLNSNIFDRAISIAPALKPYVVRFSVAGFLLLMISYSDTMPDDVILYYTNISAVLIGLLFIGVAKIGAIIGR